MPLRGKPHYIFNDDGDGLKLAPHPHTRERATAPIEYLKDTPVDCFCWCLVDGVASYDSKVLQTIYDLYDRDKQCSLSQSDLSRTLYRQGIDYLPILIRRTRALGKAFYASFRMNDTHHKSHPNGVLASDFWKNNPQYRLWGETDALSYYNAGLDYAFPEVRRREFAAIREVAARYDVDGVELDFSRVPYLFQPGEAWANRGILTRFIRAVRRGLDRIGAERRRRIGLMIRTVFGEDRLAHGGMDVPRWIRDGLMDILVMTDLANDCNREVQPWLVLCRKRGIAFYAAIENGPWIDRRNFHDFVENPDAPPHNWVVRQSSEQLVLRSRAVAQNMLAQGVDGIYLFNHTPRPIPVEYFNPAGQRPKLPLCEWGSLETLCRRDKQYLFWAGLPIYVEALRPSQYHQTIPFATRGPDIGARASRVVLRFRQVARRFPHVARYRQPSIVKPGFVTYALNGRPIPEERIERKRQGPGRIPSGFRLRNHELVEIHLPGTALRSGNNTLAFEIPKYPHERDPYVFIYEFEVDVRFGNACGLRTAGTKPSRQSPRCSTDRTNRAT
ncbi:MAG: hypothetical protein HY360_10485 [Verrucomicrobia bacterium]|nr:hypothetical protein [Verrucomicrobiota bacterium]